MKYASLRKLTINQVREIRNTRKPWDRAFSIRALARRFGVNDKVIVRVCARHGYKEIDYAGKGGITT